MQYPDIDLASLRQIEKNFHDVIMGRADDLIKEHSLTLPDLSPLLANPVGHKEWFPVPGMYGGFAYWFSSEECGVTLITESWCRVVGGSGQRHEITSKGSKLADEGFV